LAAALARAFDRAVSFVGAVVFGFDFFQGAVRADKEFMDLIRAKSCAGRGRARFSRRTSAGRIWFHGNGAFSPGVPWGRSVVWPFPASMMLEQKRSVLADAAKYDGSCGAAGVPVRRVAAGAVFLSTLRFGQSRVCLAGHGRRTDSFL
jgi:hypothetical protein